MFIRAKTNRFNSLLHNNYLFLVFRMRHVMPKHIKLVMRKMRSTNFTEQKIVWPKEAGKNV